MTNNQNKLNKQSGLILKPLNPQVQLRPAPIWSKALGWTIIATASFGFVFAVFARIDEVVLAERLQPPGAERPVKAPFSGVIKNISVKEGQKVRKGDTLLMFDPEVSKRKETLEVQLKLEEKRFEEESRSIRAREQSVRRREMVMQGR